MKLSQLERDLLDWFKAHCEDPAVREQLAVAVPVRRKTDVFGEFLSLDVPEVCEPADDDLHLISGPRIVSPDMPGGADCRLYLERGFVKHIEMHSFGDPFPLDLDRYFLESR